MKVISRSQAEYQSLLESIIRRVFLTMEITKQLFTVAQELVDLEQSLQSTTSSQQLRSFLRTRINSSRIASTQIYQVRLIFISLNYNLVEEKEVIEPRVSAFGVVRRLREQRYCMVQVMTQYEFIYEYVNQWIQDRGYFKSSPKGTIQTSLI